MSYEHSRPAPAGSWSRSDDKRTSDDTQEIPERLRPSAGVAPAERSTATPRVAGDGPPGAPLPTEPAEPATAAGPVPGVPDAGAAVRRRGPRRARLAVKRVDPWSVLKVSFLYSLALLVVILVAVVVLYAVLSAMGVFDAVDSFVRDINSGSQGIGNYVSLRRALGAAALVGAVNVVLFTALATLGAFIYNLCTDLVGGIEVTLTERD